MLQHSQITTERESHQQCCKMSSVNIVYNYQPSHVTDWLHTLQ